MVLEEVLLDERVACYSEGALVPIGPKRTFLPFPLWSASTFKVPSNQHNLVFLITNCGLATTRISWLLALTVSRLPLTLEITDDPHLSDTIPTAAAHDDLCRGIAPEYTI